jgi:DNA-directed RNA polymerase specialized sigma24 family protein
MDDRPTDFLSQATLKQLTRIEAQARRRLRDPTLADEAVNFVLDRLQANDWQRVRLYQGRASFETFLATVTARLLEDFLRHRFGRVRIPDWVRARGALWQLIFRLLCMERRTVPEAVQIAAESAPEGRDRQMVEAAAQAIRVRVPNCGAPGPMQTDATDLDTLPQDPEAVGTRTAGSPDAQVLEDEQVALLQTLGERLLGQSAPQTPDRALSSTVAAELKDRLRLGSEERLLLKLVFEDGFNVTAAGAMLGYNAHQAHGRLRRLLQRVRTVLEGAGIRFYPEDFR